MIAPARIMKPVANHQVAQADIELGQCSVRVHPPFGAPDTTDAPAEIRQHGLTQAITITGGRGAVIGRAIALHASQVPTRRVRMDDAEVDPEARDADLRVDSPAFRFERRFHC